MGNERAWIGIVCVMEMAAPLDLAGASSALSNKWDAA